MTGASRYHRQMLLPFIREDGQARLLSAHALLVGVGALGCTIADLLVRGGVGCVTLVDRDIVELSNLQRQSLYSERDAAEGLPKAVAAQRRLREVNSSVVLRAITADFMPDNADAIAAGDAIGDAPAASSAGVIIDGTDNFETRYLMNDLAVKLGIPYVYGGAVGSHGMQMTVRAGGRPCLRCIFEELPEPGTAATCDTAGVFAPVAVMVAAREAADAMKLLAGRDDAVDGALRQFDVLTGQERRLDVSRMARSDCTCCGRRIFEFLEGHRGGGTVTLCGSSSVQVMPPDRERRGRVDLEQLSARLAPHGRFSAGRFVMRGEFARELGTGGAALALTVFPDGRAIVHGTTDPARARAVYSRYIGG
jgi:molybdopterin-synthase adenylyltransferase